MRKKLNKINKVERVGNCEEKISHLKEITLKKYFVAFGIMCNIFLRSKVTAWQIKYYFYSINFQTFHFIESIVYFLEVYLLSFHH